jgi:hypothetical protein
MENNVNEINGAISKFQGEVETVKFDKENPFYKSRYATLSAIMTTIRKPLANNGLAIVQKIESVINSVDGIAKSSEIKIITKLLHKSGQEIETALSLSAMTDVQKMGSTITYGRRYALSALLGIVSDDDEDGNEAKPPVQNQTKPPVQNQAKPPVQSPPKPPAQGQTKDLSLFTKRFGVIHVLLKKHNIDPTKAHKYYQVEFGVKSMNDLSCETMQAIIDRINALEKGTTDKTIEDLKDEIDLNFTETMEAKQ